MNSVRWCHVVSNNGCHWSHIIKIAFSNYSDKWVSLQWPGNIWLIWPKCYNMIWIHQSLVKKWGFCDWRWTRTWHCEVFTKNNTDGSVFGFFLLNIYCIYTNRSFLFYQYSPFIVSWLSQWRNHLRKSFSSQHYSLDEQMWSLTVGLSLIKL